jgi:PAS domain-containing protein
VFASAAALRNATSDKDQVAQINQWLEVALNNMARGLSMFDAQQRLLLCNNIYRDIYNLPEELTGREHRLPTSCAITPNRRQVAIALRISRPRKVDPAHVADGGESPSPIHSI